jgi:threonylcarbamoyladenosine tRNA methylthiotransferase MtaB
MTSEANAVEVVSFGCRTNIVESEAMRQAVITAGLRDLVIVNTCAVTAEAVRQARQSIRRLRRERPTAAIVVTGCAAQVEPGRFAEMPEVTAVLGNAEKTLAQTWTKIDLWAGGGRVEVSDIMRESKLAPARPQAFSAHTRGFVQIQTGCDHRCTFCIIPFARGRSRSVPAGEVVDQIRQLVESGHREVVLTGVDLTAYGRDLPAGLALGELVKAILAGVPRLERLRLSSLDSCEIDETLIEAFAVDRRLMPQLHLSIQSGSDMILKRMKRRHRRAELVAFCDRLRRLRPDILVGADLIVGFPTETSAQFDETETLIEDCGLALCHVFAYSARPGTPAARMPMVAAPLVRERAKRLRETAAAAYRRHLARQVGRRLSVLCERGGLARAEDSSPVRLAAAVPGTLTDVRIVGSDGTCLFA